MDRLNPYAKKQRAAAAAAIKANTKGTKKIKKVFIYCYIFYRIRHSRRLQELLTTKLLLP